MAINNSEGDIRLIELDDGTEQWFDADDLCERCEEAPVAPPEGYRREVEDQRGTLCETCRDA